MGWNLLVLVCWLPSQIPLELPVCSPVRICGGARHYCLLPPSLSLTIHLIYSRLSRKLYAYSHSTALCRVFLCFGSLLLYYHVVSLYRYAHQKTRSSATVRSRKGPRWNLFSQNTRSFISQKSTLRQVASTTLPARII